MVGKLLEILHFTCGVTAAQLVRRWSPDHKGKGSTPDGAGGVTVGKSLCKTKLLLLLLLLLFFYSADTIVNHWAYSVESM